MQPRPRWRRYTARRLKMTSRMDRVDCVVVGAGAIGLAVARPDLAPAAPRR